MTSQKSTQAANVTTAADELTRFARYLEFNTRDLRESVATFLVGPSTPKPPTTFRERRQQEEDDGLWDDRVNIPGDDWVEVTTDALDAPEDFSQQIYHPPATPPPGPIEETALAAQRAALQALGLTGTYLEHGLRLAAEDVGWLTHTATFEDAVQKVQKRFPMLKKLGESYGKGALKESARRRESGAAAAPAEGCQRLSREELAQFGAMEEV